MGFSFAQLMGLLPMVGPAVAATTEFIDRFQLLIKDQKPEDQEELRDALADVQADNDEGHKRLQEKLKKAAGR